MPPRPRRNNNGAARELAKQQQAEQERLAKMSASCSELLENTIPRLAKDKAYRTCADAYREAYDLIRGIIRGYKNLGHRVVFPVMDPDVLLPDGSLAEPSYSYPLDAPDPQYFALHGYSAYLRDKGITATDEDLAYLRETWRDAEPHEAAFIGYTLGCLYGRASRKEECVKAYRRALKLTISEEQRKKVIMGCSVSETKTAGEEFDFQIAACQKELDLQTKSDKVLMYNGAILPVHIAQRLAEDPGSRTLLRQVHNKETGWALPDDVVRRYLEQGHRIVGAQCDRCGVPPSAELKLLKCKVCLRKAYCSKACQKEDWVQGKHKASCRPPKDFRPRDIIRVQGMPIASQLSGELLVVLGLREGVKSAAGLAAWDCAEVGADKVLLVLSEDKMQLVVPVEERVDSAA